MIAERFPGLLQLPVKERLLLAEELYDTVFQFGEPVVDDQIFKELQEGWAGYLKNPDAAVKWDDLKTRLASRNAWDRLDFSGGDSSAAVVCGK